MSEPTRKQWLENVYNSKIYAFVTSGWLAACVIGFLLAVVYVLLKIEPLAPQTEIMTIEPIAPTKQVVKPAIKKEAAKAANKPVTADVGIPITDKKTVKPTEPLNQFERDLANFESKL